MKIKLFVVAEQETDADLKRAVVRKLSNIAAASDGAKISGPIIKIPISFKLDDFPLDYQKLFGDLKADDLAKSSVEVWDLASQDTFADLSSTICLKQANPSDSIVLRVGNNFDKSMKRYTFKGVSSYKLKDPNSVSDVEDLKRIILECFGKKIEKIVAKEIKDKARREEEEWTNVNRLDRKSRTEIV